MTYKIDADNYNGSITFLIHAAGASLELRDRVSGTRFAAVELDVQQLAELLSRRSDTPCDITITGLDRIGKQMNLDVLDFEMPSQDRRERKEVAILEAKRLCPDGWTPDLYFGSQSSFFRKDGKEYAQTYIRRWV